MLQLNLRRAMVHVQRKQLLHEPPPDGGKAGAAYVPQQAAKMRGHAALALDAHYLNMNINELEPLIEPWVMSGHAVRPLGLRITSGRIYSSRLLQLNLSMALQRTLNHIASVQQKHRLSSVDRSDHLAGPADDKQYTVQDRASGVGGEFVIVERRSDRQRRRSSASGASGKSGKSGKSGASGASGKSGASGAEDRSPSRRSTAEAEAASPSRRADGHRLELNPSPSPSPSPQP